ncbi:MAG: hypothetical protein AAGJ08_05160 [Cyanobacteria bacterium P01_H01_bin.35]
MTNRQPHDGLNRESVLQELKILNETNNAIIQELKELNQTITKFKKVAKAIFTLVFPSVQFVGIVFILYCLFNILMFIIKVF